MTTKLDDIGRSAANGRIAGAAFDVYEPEPLPSARQRPAPIRKSK
jgi:phosphoglycerate dehydrogenase-like enzyme